jgi:purine-binding chemotaxis protein CheW
VNDAGEHKRRELLIFELDGQRCGLPVADVKEIVRAVLPVSLPGTPPIVEGVINVRGSVVPVLDIRRAFSLPPKPLEHTDHFIVAWVGKRLVALHIDRAVGLVHLTSADVDNFENAVPGENHLAGIARVADDLVLIQDLAAWLRTAEGGRP